MRLWGCDLKALAHWLEIALTWKNLESVAKTYEILLIYWFSMLVASTLSAS